ncbi:MAG: helix-turn-helix domain-containing protein, partial [Pseudonocardiaceae bacterium]
MGRELPDSDARSAGDSPWLSHEESAGEIDDGGAVLRAWRVDAGRTQTDVAGVLKTTQQHLSQLEKGQRPLSLEQRRKMV